MTTAHTSLGLPHGLVYVRVWGREVLHEVTRGLSRGLGGVQPALWGVGSLRCDNRPPQRGRGASPENTSVHEVEIHHPLQGAAPAN